MANKQVVATVSDAYASAERGKNISLGVIAVGVLVVGLLGMFLLTNVRAAFGRIETMVGWIGNDPDFTLRVEATRQDEIGRTVEVLNRLLGKLQGNLKSIASGAQVSTAAWQMSELSGSVASSSASRSAEPSIAFA